MSSFLGTLPLNLTLTLIWYIPNFIPQIWTFKIISDDIYILFDGHFWVFGSFISAWKNSLYLKYCILYTAWKFFPLLCFPKGFFFSSREGGVCGIWCVFSVCHSGRRSQWRCILDRRLVDQIPLRSTWPSWNIAADTVRSDIKVTLNYDSNVICCICMSIYINLVTDECDLSRCCI